MQIILFVYFELALFLSSCQIYIYPILPVTTSFSYTKFKLCFSVFKGSRDVKRILSTVL